jgi:hypothetical protein
MGVTMWIDEFKGGTLIKSLLQRSAQTALLKIIRLTSLKQETTRYCVKTSC